jgi:hypothetical protein
MPTTTSPLTTPRSGFVQQSFVLFEGGQEELQLSDPEGNRLRCVRVKVVALTFDEGIRVHLLSKNLPGRVGSIGKFRCFGRRWYLHAKDFARVHNVVRVDCRLDCTHHADRLAMLSE